MDDSTSPTNQTKKQRANTIKMKIQGELSLAAKKKIELEKIVKEKKQKELQAAVKK